MRVAYLHQYFSTPEMAGGTRSYEMARRMVRRGWQVDLITSDRRPARQSPRWWVSDVDGIRVHWTPVPYSNRMEYPERVRAFLRFAWRAARRASSLCPDVVFASSTPLTIALPAAWAAWRRRVPMVFEVRDLWPEVPVAMGALRSPLATAAAFALERFAYARSAHVVACSEGMKAGIVQAGYPSEQVSVIPNACDTELFDVPASVGETLRAQTSWLGDKPLVLYAGTLGAVNGVDYLVLVAAAVRPLAPHVRFAVLGDGRELGKVRAMAEAAGLLGDTFHILPPVPKREMPRWLSAATLSTSLVIDHPVMWANSANKVFDGLAAGRPVMINHGGWQAELLEREGAGFSVPSRDPEAAAEMLVRHLSDTRWLERAGAAGRRLAAGPLNRDHLAERLAQVIEAVVPRGGQG